ncbi:50S ribosomal protein L1 [Patescibacteria group bacterium]|jgi:large subunit ribosomal protein L1|nr:50S ribosomal protein L1 [Patescibacteria group bacterium]
MKEGKKYHEAKKLVSSTQQYSVAEAVALVKKMSYSKFDGTIELGIKTFANPKYNDQMIRATVVLPNGTGKTQKVAVFVTDDKVDEAKKAGADVVGYNDLLADIKAEKINFDVLITTPDLIREMASVAKVLGPKGLMPSPKAGTVTANITEAISEVKRGRLEFKLDKAGNIHGIVGKVSFDDKALEENVAAFLKAIESNKPTGVKAKLIKKVVLSATMSPGVQIAY